MAQNRLPEVSTTYVPLTYVYSNTLYYCLPISSQVKHSKTCLDPAQEKTVLSQLTSLLNQLDIALPQYSVKEYRQLLKREGELRDLQERGREVLRKEFGFSLEVCTSHLKEGGKGVIVTDGRVPSGHLVGLYPGMTMNKDMWNV